MLTKLCNMQGLVQAGGVAASVFHARFALFEVLQRLNGGRPTEALLLGCLLLGAGIGCMPLVLLQHSQSQLARRALVLVAALGMLLVMLRPPLPAKVCLTSITIAQSICECSMHMFWFGWLLCRLASVASNRQALSHVVAFWPEGVTAYRAAWGAQGCLSGSVPGCGICSTARAWRRMMPPSTARPWRGGATGPSGSLWCAPTLIPSTGFMQAYLGCRKFLVPCMTDASRGYTTVHHRLRQT